MNSATNTKRWRILNSLWLILAFVPVLNFTAFLYIGTKARDKTYIISGAIHLTITVILMVIFFASFADALFFLAVLHYIVIVVQALLSRKKYLWKLRKQQDQEFLANQLYEQQFASRVAETMAGSGTQPAQNPVNFAAAVEAPVYEAPVYEAPAVSMALVNVNDCDEAALAALPGLSIVDAKKAIAYREQHGAFPTVESFIATLGIKPHIAVQLTGRITVGPTAGSRGRTGGGVVRQLDF